MRRRLRVWILQTGEPLHCDGGFPRPMRAMNLANSLVARGHDVVLWSSAFYHQEKRHRTTSHESVWVGDKLEIRLVPSPGYRRNIGPGRLRDHFVMARNLSRWLGEETSEPDVAFVGYPPIETADVMARWLAARRVPFMVDVKDLWPSIFVDPLPAALRPFGNAILAPYAFFGRRAMRKASGLSAMASEYLDWARVFAGRSEVENDRVVPLTSPEENLSAAELADAGAWWDAQGVPADGRPRVFFVGSLARSFDFEPVVEAARRFNARKSPLQFVLCGDGERFADLRTQTEALDNVVMPGWIDRARIAVLGIRSNGALAPYFISDSFNKTVPNKVVDSMRLGIPIVTPLVGEVSRLIRDHGVGVQYEAGSAESLCGALDSLLSDEGRQREMATRARALYLREFSFDTVYGGLVDHLERMARR